MRPVLRAISLKLLLLSVSVATSGCAFHPKLVTPNLSASSQISSQLPAHFGLHVGDDIKDLSRKVKSSTFVGSFHSFTYDLGTPAAAVIEQATRNAILEVTTFSDTNEFQQEIQRGRLDGYLTVRLEDAVVDIAYSPGTTKSTANANVRLTIEVEALDAKGSQLFVEHLMGEGVSSEPVLMPSSDDFTPGIEQALTDLGEKVGRLLSSSGRLRSYKPRRVPG